MNIMKSVIKNHIRKGVESLTNTDLLKRKIDESGYKMQFIAEYIGVSYQALYNKIGNKTEFLASEIMKLSELLKLTDEERNEIFFAESVT